MRERVSKKDLILKGNFRWIDWFESAQMLLSKVEKIKKVSLKVKKGDIDRVNSPSGI